MSHQKNLFVSKGLFFTSDIIVVPLTPQSVLFWSLAPLESKRKGRWQFRLKQIENLVSLIDIYLGLLLSIQFLHLSISRLKGHTLQW